MTNQAEANANALNQNGFTLIEIMIAMTIMAALTVLTASAIQSALRNSSKYRRQIEEAAEIRDVLRVIQRDINLAFHHRSPQKEMLEEIKKELGKDKEDEQVSQNARDQEKNKNLTAFVGKSDSVHFTTLNNARTLVDAKESDQMEVGYYLRSCRKRSNPKLSSLCLWRRSSVIIDSEVDKGGGEFVILEDIKEFKMTYIGDPETPEGDPIELDSWSSLEDAPDDRTKKKFPNAVKVEVTVNRKIAKKTVPQSASTTVALRFPNNAPPKKEETPADGNNGDNNNQDNNNDN